MNSSIRKVAVALALLPLVGSLAAPEAALAQSAFRTSTDIRVERELGLLEEPAWTELGEEPIDTMSLGEGRPAILLTGYWPPTNEMLRRFSTDPVKNPSGWIGANWEGRGYDVYSFFPTFVPPNCSNCGKGFGDLTVDYQDTVADWEAITTAIRPVGIITFSRGFIDLSWELEMNQYNRASWFGDFCAPPLPTPSPPDASAPAGFLRQSQLPVEEIRDAVNAAGLGISARICVTGDGGGFLSEFIAYLGVWYQAQHADPNDPAHCVTAGHVHVGGLISWPFATRAAEVTLRTVMDQIDVRYAPTTLAAFGGGGVDAGCGPSQTVLFVNGSSGGPFRTVGVAVGEPFSVSIVEAPSRVGDGRSSRVAVFGWIAAPAPSDIVEVPGGYGPMCFGFGPLATRAPDRVWNSLGLERLFGPHDAPNIGPPVIGDGESVTLVSRPLGIMNPADLTFQGIIQDRCSGSPAPFSVTNAVMARITSSGSN